VIFLLDVNVLIALADPFHIFHNFAHKWFEPIGSAGWATCSTTENGLLRIMGNARYPTGPGSPSAVAPILTGMRILPGHHFWPEDFSLIDTAHINPGAIKTSAQMTDTWLLALAVRHGGQLATFDRRIVTSAVIGGPDAICLIPTS
jgi:uncharacterized protein